MARLERFKEAQNSSYGGFDAALAEMKTGGKTGHWIWYVFPQIRGLGRSGTALEYAIDDSEEAAAFLRDEELRSRLLTITTVVAEQLKSGRVTLRALMGSEIDALKLVSSMTLFGRVAKKLSASEGVDVYGPLAEVADEVLTLAASQGYPACAYTLRKA